MTALEDAMNKLNSNWYNALVENLNLNPNQFQICQGVTSLGSTSDGLWRIFDAIPPKSTSNYYDPNQYNRFSSNYHGVLASLNQPVYDNLQRDLGDYYNIFMTAWKADTSTDSMYDFFTEWSKKNCPDKTAAGQTDIDKIDIQPLTNALQKWKSAADKQKAYTTTVDLVISELNRSRVDKNFTMNSTENNTNVSQSWAKTTVSGWYSIFGGKIDIKYNDFVLKILNSGITVDITIENSTTIAASPLDDVNTSNPILSQYKPWFEGTVLNDAFKHNDFIVWNPNSPTGYNDFFGSDGTMLRVVSALVVADGIKIDIKTNEVINESDFSSFKNLAAGGIWPFFIATSETSWQQLVNHNDNGTVTVHSESPRGSPQILGVLVSPIGK